MDRNRLQFIMQHLIVLPLMMVVMFVVVGPENVHAAGGVGASCTSNIGCNSGLVCDRCDVGHNWCTSTNTCQPLKIGLYGTEMRSTQILSYIEKNVHYVFDPPAAIDSTTFYGCLGFSSACLSQPTSNASYWTSFGTANYNAAWFHYDNLRPSRSYAFTIQGTSNGSTASAQQTGLVTAPGFNPTTTNTDLGCTSGTCGRRIQWHLDQKYDSYPNSIKYGRVAPTWSVDSSWQSTGATWIGAFAVAPSGTVWALNNIDDGTFMKRDVTGSWTPGTISAGSTIREIEVFDDTVAWAYGASGVWMTTNGGANWTSTDISMMSGTPGAVRAVSPSTAVAVDQTGSVYYFAAGAWTKKVTRADSCANIATVSGRTVWISCIGQLLTIPDIFAATPTVTQFSTVGGGCLSIDAADEKSIYAACGATLYHSADAGSSWVTVPVSPSISAISSIQMMGPDRFWGFGTFSAFLYDKNAITPFTIYTFPGAVLRSKAGPNDAMYAIANGDNFWTYKLPSVDAMYTDTLTTYTSQDLSFDITGLLPNTTYYYDFNSPNHVTAGSWFASGGFGTFTTPLNDTTPPTISIATPAGPYPLATKVCPLAVSGSAADTAPGSVTGVTVSIDGGTPSTATGTTSWSATLPCGSLPQGPHTITATASDGFNTTSASISIIFDQTGPTSTITAPSPVATSTVTASGTATDALDKVATVAIQVNGGAQTPLTITPGTTVNWSAPGLTLTPGVNTIVVFVTDRAGNVGSSSTNVTYNVPSFTLDVTPNTNATVTAGTILTYTLSITPINGHNTPINITSVGISNLGLSVTKSGSTFTVPYGTITVNVNTTNAPPGGPYFVSVQASDGTISQTVKMFMTILPAPDFSLSAVPGNQTVVAGNNGSFSMHVGGNSTYVYPTSPGISWTTGTLPTGVTASFSPLTGDPSNNGTGTSTLTLTTTSQFADTAIDVTATDGTHTHTVQIHFTASPAPDFSLSIAPASAATTAGTTVAAAYNITVTSIGGFSGFVFFAPLIPDPAISASFSPPLVNLTTTGTSTMNVNVDSPVQCAPPGPCAYTLTVRATGGGLPAKTQTVTLNVTPDTTAPTITGITASPSFNSVTSSADVTVSWTTNELANSRITLYPDASQNDSNIYGTLFDPATCTAACHTITYPNLPPSTKFYYSVTSVDQAYPSGNSTTTKMVSGIALSFTTPAAPDNIPPTITISSPSGGTVLGTVNIAGTAADDVSMDHVNIKIAGTTVDINLPCSGGANVPCSYSYQWNTASPPIPNASYSIAVTAVASNGPSLMASKSVTVTVFNDNTAPQVACLPGQTVCEPEAVNLQCGAATCSISIHWLTDDKATSEVDFGLSSSYGTKVRYDRTNPSDANPKYTDHWVDLTGLTKNALYHYKITSCNVSLLCTN